MKFLSKFDLFGRNIQILFQNQRNHKTQFGGLISLILVLGFCIFVLIQYNESKYPRQLVRNQVYVENARMYDLNDGNFNIAFGLQDKNFDHYIDESLYTIEAVHVTFKRTFNSETEEKTNDIVKKVVILEQCKEDHFTVSVTKDYFRSLNYQGMYCFQKNQQLPIEGDFDSERFSFIQLNIKTCQNKTTCKPLQDIKEAYKYTNLALYFTNNFIDLELKDNPFHQKSQDVFISSGIPLAKELFMYYQNTKLIDKGGFYNEQVNLRENLTFDKYQESTIPFIEEEGSMFRVTFRHSKQQEINVVRFFQPYSFLLSQLGGFYQFLLALGCLICYPISQIDLNIQLINSLFNIDQTQEDDIKVQPQVDDKQVNQSFLSKFKDKFSTKRRNNSIFRQPDQTDLSQIEHQSTPKKQQFQSETNQQLFKQKPNTMMEIKLQQENQNQTNFEKNLENRPVRNSLSVISTIAQQPVGQGGLGQNSKVFQQLLYQRRKTIGGGNIVQSDQVLTKISKVKDRIKQMNLFRKYFQVNSVQFSIWKYFILNLFCCKRFLVKKKQLNKSISQLYSQLDVHNILQKLIEIDKLKMLILNDNQRKLFEYLPQPKIFTSPPQETIEQKLMQNIQNQKDEQISNIQENQADQPDIQEKQQNQFGNNEKHPNKIDILYQNNKSLLERAEDAWHALKELQYNSQNQSELDKKLLQMIDPQFFEVFNDLAFEQAQQEDTSRPISYTENQPQFSNIALLNNKLAQFTKLGSFKDQNSSFNSLSRLAKEAKQKHEKDYIQKKSDFYQQIDLQQEMHKNYKENQMNKQETQEYENKNYIENESHLKGNGFDSNYPLSENMNKIREIDCEQENPSNYSYNEEYFTNSYYNIFKNNGKENMKELENEIKYQIQVSQINNTNIEIDQKANKLFSKIKSSNQINENAQTPQKNQQNIFQYSSNEESNQQDIKS